MRTLSSSVVELRRQFDEAFSVGVQESSSERIALIRIKVGETTFAVKTSDITSVAKVRELLLFPSPVATLLGIATVRGALVPVYDLSTLLGRPNAVSHASWLVLANREKPIGIAFDELEGQLEVTRAGLLESGPGPHRHTAQILQLGTESLPVIDVAGLVNEIQQNLAPIHAIKE